MTLSPDAPRVQFDDLEDAVAALRESGLRLSTARRLALQALFAAEGPVSAAHLARELAIDESSVYRNLEVLERHGLLRHVHLGHGPGLYVLVGRDEVEYLYCERCARVTSVSPAQLDPVRQQIKEQFGHVARFTHFAIVGLCEQCAASPEPGSGADDGETAAEGSDRHRHRRAGDAGDEATTGEHPPHSHGLVDSHAHARAGRGRRHEH